MQALCESLSLSLCLNNIIYNRWIFVWSLVCMCVLRTPSLCPIENRARIRQYFFCCVLHYIFFLCVITYFTHSNNEYDCTIICTILYYIITYIWLRLKTTDWSEEEEEAVTVAAATNSSKYLKGTVTPAAIYILYIEVLGIFFLRRKSIPFGSEYRWLMLDNFIKHFLWTELLLVNNRLVYFVVVVCSASTTATCSIEVECGSSRKWVRKLNLRFEENL